MSFIEPYERRAVTRPDGPRLAGHLVYGIYALSVVTAVPMFIGVVIAYIVRSEYRWTVFADHFTWAIRTFWAVLLLGILFGALTWVLIGWPLLGLLWLWLIYRILRGWLAVANGTPLYAR